MPTTYAHYRFGQEVYERLPDPLRQIIDRHRSIYDFGVHGPDFLFYYHPLRKNRIIRIGYACHEQTGRQFFTAAARTIYASADRDAAMSYLLGVACHYVLDRECHPYVGEKERTGASHSEIEASFDRFLLLKDGLDPLRHRVTAHLIPSEISALTMAPFYPTISTADAYYAQKGMLTYLNMLIAPPGAKRSGLISAMKLAGRPSLIDLLITPEQNPKCIDSDAILFDHYQAALEAAPDAIAELVRHTADGTPLGTFFDHTFGEN